MSWTSRLGNLGRFSPFTRSPPQGGIVGDNDFSYITADDLRQHQAESAQQEAPDPDDSGPPRETDVLRVRNKRNEYAIHFPAYSISKGELTIGQVREHAAKKVGTGDPRRVKLLHRGKNLKDDSRTCKQEGLRHDVELMCTVADGGSLDEESDDDDDDELADGNEDGAADTKRKRNRGKRTKRRNKREDRDGPSGTATPQGTEPSLSLPTNQPSRAQSPRPPATPATPLDKLNQLHQTLQKFMPDVEAFKRSPPTDHSKKEYEHKKLSETILAQVLLKLDAVETEGDADARTRRKELVRETQNVLTELDATMK